MKIKAALFDADGVVINSENFSIEYRKKHDISYDEMIPFFKGEFQNCLIGKADLVEIIKPWLQKWKGDTQEFLQFWFKTEHKLDKKLMGINY